MKFLQNLHQFGKILSDFIFVANLNLKPKFYHIFFPQDFIYQISFCFCKSKKKKQEAPKKGKKGSKKRKARKARKARKKKKLDINFRNVH